eukprot:COSAG06_NODE_38251_length_425_cov_1.478528_1_plen_78_part_01
MDATPSFYCYCTYRRLLHIVSIYLPIDLSLSLHVSLCLYVSIVRPSVLLSGRMCCALTLTVPLTHTHRRCHSLLSLLS